MEPCKVLTMEQVNALLRHRPAVHHLCAGSWIQMSFEMGEGVLAVPLRSLGFAAEIGYLARYTHEIVRAGVDQGVVTSLLRETTDSQPVIALCLQLEIDAPAEALEEVATERLDRARHVLAWTSGRSATLIGVVVAATEATYFRPVAPPYRNRRQLFGIGGSASDYQQSLLRVATRAKADTRFAFALSLYHDAVAEENAQFRIARFFNVLEALASGLKSTLPSRQAVKRLLGLADGASIQMRYETEDYRFDGIEIAGRIRDKLFHGTPFRESDLDERSRPVFALISAHASDVADLIAGYCELELNRWANGTSLGQVAPIDE